MEKTLEHLINKMFEIAGYSLTYNDVKHTDFWDNYTMTKVQEENLLNYALSYLRNQYSCATLAEQKAKSFVFAYSLKIKNEK